MAPKPRQPPWSPSHDGVPKLGSGRAVHLLPRLSQGAIGKAGPPPKAMSKRAPKAKPEAKRAPNSKAAPKARAKAPPPVAPARDTPDAGTPPVDTAPAAAGSPPPRQPDAAAAGTGKRAAEGATTDGRRERKRPRKEASAVAGPTANEGGTLSLQY